MQTAEKSKSVKKPPKSRFFNNLLTCQSAFDDENKNLFQRENVSVHPQGSGTLWLYSFRSNNWPETLFIER